MFKPLVWEQEKENGYKAVVNVCSGNFRNHTTYRVFLHKGEYWRLMVSGVFVGLVEYDKSATKEEAMAKAEEDYQNNLLTLQKALDALKV